MKSRLTAGFALVVCLALLPAFIPDAGTQSRETTGEVCATCHADNDPATGPDFDFDKIAQSIHAELTCADCHPGVTTTHDADLPPASCSSCHADASGEFIGSVHARADGEPITCGTCHDGHTIQAVRQDDTSNRLDVSDTCGHCHTVEQEEFQRSIHYTALLDDDTAHWAPDCTTCHGVHRVYTIAAPASPISPGRLPGTCGGCHDDPEFAESVGVSEERLASYKDSIHGLRNRFGQENIATCKDCHGVHSVLPPDDPASTVSKENILATCSACHEEANENFVAATVHVRATPESSIGVFIVRWFYIIFIVVLVVGFLLHVSFDLIARRRKRKEGAG